jgi:membrane protein implicated in regulation of membrane protease activity
MLRYYYALAPPVIAGAVILLTLPWLGLIALMIFAVAAVGTLAAVAWALVFVPYRLGLALARRRHIRRDTSPGTAATTLSLVEREDA